MPVRRWIALLALVPLACGKSGSGEPAVVAGTSNVVKVASPKKQTLRWSVEQPGTMEHSYTIEEFGARYRQAFGEDLP